MNPAYLGDSYDVVKRFADPDTGIRSAPGRSHATFGSITEYCERFALVIVFDQSFSRGANARSAVTAKLTELRTRSIRGIYYGSHARFLVCGKSSARVMRFQKVLIQAGLPPARLVGIRPSAA